MSYFPEHYIKPNQYTAGGEFMYASSKIEYKGWYWSTGNGRYYTGKTPQASENLEIVKMILVGNDLGFENEPLYTNKIKLALKSKTVWTMVIIFIIIIFIILYIQLCYVNIYNIYLMVNKIPSNFENPLDVLLLKFIDTHLDSYNTTIGGISITPNIITTISLILGINQ